MGQIARSVSDDEVINRDDGALEVRIFRVMAVSVVAATAIAGLIAPWRVTLGIMLGGALALLNYHWLRSSVEAIFQLAGAAKPRVKISRYVIRYVLIGSLVFAAYKFDLVSLPATVAGLCAFVPALFVEAARQFYFAIITGEESF